MWKISLHQVMLRNKNKKINKKREIEYICLKFLKKCFSTEANIIIKTT